MKNAVVVSAEDYAGAEYVKMLCEQWATIGNDFMAMGIPNCHDHIVNAALLFSISTCKSFEIPQEAFEEALEFMRSQYKRARAPRL